MKSKSKSPYFYELSFLQHSHTHLLTCECFHATVEYLSSMEPKAGIIFVWLFTEKLAERCFKASIEKLLTVNMIFLTTD